MKQEKHEIRCSEIEKRLGKCRFFEKSYKNTRTKNSVSHSGYAIFDTPGGTRKGVKKTCQWHVFSPWESPFSFQTRPVGVWMEWKHLVSGVSHPGYTVFVFSIKGTRKFKCNSPVDCCLPPARRRQHLSVTSPFWRTATPKRKGGTRKGGSSVCSGLRLWQHGQ